MINGKDLIAVTLQYRPENPLLFMSKCLDKIQSAANKGDSMDFKVAICTNLQQLFIELGDSFKQEQEQEKTVDNLFSGFSGDGFAPEEPTNGGQVEAKTKAEDEDEEEIADLPAMKKYNHGQIASLRRGSVSAESYKPSDEEYEKIVIPKSNDAKKRIESAISNNLLFRNLEKEQRNEIIDAMFEKKVAKGVAIINQGEEGDNFYVVDSGAFDVFVNGNKVVEIGAGGSFGELALMYNTPRAASVIANQDCVVWAVDRVTFRRIVTNNMFRKRKLYENFLRTVPILNSLDSAEVTKIADALEPIEYKDGEDVVRQGEEGDSFYILVNGEAKVTITKEGEPHEMMRYHPGDYFGEIALVNDSARAATVTAIGNIKVVSLNRAAFIRLLGPIMDILKRNIDDYKKYEEYDQ